MQFLQFTKQYQTIPTTARSYTQLHQTIPRSLYLSVKLLSARLKLAKANLGTREKWLYIEAVVHELTTEYTLQENSR